MILSHHARQQAARRNFSEKGIRFIIEHGKRRHNSGVIFFQLLKKSIPKDIAPNDPNRKLEGSTVVACPTCGEFVITLYKNPDAFKADMKKDKFNRHKEESHCPICNEDDMLH